MGDELAIGLVGADMVCFCHCRWGNFGVNLESCSQSYCVDMVGLVAAVELTASYEPSRLSLVSPPSEDNDTE